MKQKIFGLITAFLALFVIVACHDKDKEPDPVSNPVVKVEKVSLDSEEISMTVGETKTIQVSIVPDNATDKHVRWESSNPSVAKVENGIVEALEPGTTEITATCGDVSAKCNVVVMPKYVAVEKITLDSEEISMTVGETKTLQASIIPEDATDKQVKWESSNSLVATVSDGIVKAISKGTADITASIGDVSTICTVVVNINPDNDKYRYVFGYAYSEDLLKFLTPTIILTLDGQEPVVYSITDGNNSSAEEGIKFDNISISVNPTWATLWWIGKRYASEQKGTIQITYEPKEVDYSVYNDVDISSLFNFISNPFVDKSSGGLSMCNHSWFSITIGQKRKLKEVIDEIIESKSNTVSF